MAGWVYRMLRLSTVVGCSVAAFAAVMATSGASEPVRERGDAAVRVLQMNLCDSGHAQCYTGRSVAEASEVIRAEVPDVVTVNEVCQDDVAALEAALTGSDGGGGGAVAWSCRHSRRRGTGAPVPRSGAATAGRTGSPWSRGWRRRRGGTTPSAAPTRCRTPGARSCGRGCAWVHAPRDRIPSVRSTRVPIRRRSERPGSERRRTGRRRRLHDTPGQRQPGGGPCPVRLPARNGDPGGPGPGRIGTGDPGRRSQPAVGRLPRGGGLSPRRRPAGRRRSGAARRGDAGARGRVPPHDRHAGDRPPGAARDALTQPRRWRRRR